MNSSTYRVNGQSVQGAQYAPDSGDWMQTCNGNGNHLSCRYHEDKLNEETNGR